MATNGRSELQDLWLRRLIIARERYQAARKACKEALAQCDIGYPDAYFAYKKVLCAENAAIAEYNRVGVILCNLTLYGTTPPEE